MRRDELAELHFITPHANLPSLLKYGIQSHHRAEVGRKKGILQPASIAMQELQDIRADVQVPPGRALHDYANLYMCARNPMMYKRKERHLELCVLRISPTVLNISGAVITDGNAAVRITRFAPSPTGLQLIDKDVVFAEYWTHDDPLETRRHRAAKCAEVLIPDQVPPSYIVGAYVSCEDVAAAVREIAPALAVTVDGHMFFNEETR